MFSDGTYRDFVDLGHSRVALPTLARKDAKICNPSANPTFKMNLSFVGGSSLLDVRAPQKIRRLLN